MSNFFQNLGTGQNFLNLKSMLGFANSNTPVDQKATNAIQDSEDLVAQYNENAPSEEETLRIQNLVGEDNLPTYGIDGKWGEETANAYTNYLEEQKALTEEANLKQQQARESENYARLLTEEGRGGVTEKDGIIVPVYSAPKSFNRFS
tara:strand:+ start:330 stop:773 length:444 start_codon:yes stop_codon:yes gene_type:complete